MPGVSPRNLVQVNVEIGTLWGQKYLLIFNELRDDGSLRVPDIAEIMYENSDIERPQVTRVQVRNFMRTGWGSLGERIHDAFEEK
jgi:hypothetical protein